LPSPKDTDFGNKRNRMERIPALDGEGHGPAVPYAAKHPQTRQE